MAVKFCHLHLHSEYSMLDGVIRIPELARAVKKMGMNAVAVTDHGVMYGAIELLQACRDEGIKPIIGCEVYVAPGDRREKDPSTKHRNSHLVLLAQNTVGYKNLSTLVSTAYREGMYYKPRVDHELLSRYSEGLICSSACLRGELSQCILAGSPEKAREIGGIYKDIYGPDRFFIELQDHGLPDQERINGGLVDLARDLDVRLIATNDAHFLTPKDRFIQDVMICIQTGKKLADTNRFRAYTPNHYVKSPAEMENVFRWIPEALTNTQLIADSIEFDPPHDQFHFPEFKTPDGSSPDEFLRRESDTGLVNRLGNEISEEYKKRLKYELDVICNMGFASYFLIVSDFTRWAKNRNIPVGPGRGSAASCLVSYALDIIDVDPIKYGLLFERMLNPQRKSMPDIDMDFDPAGRADVIDYVTELYGSEHVCQIVTFNRLKARYALRDTGRVMEIPLGEVDKVAKLVPLGMDIDKSLKKDKDFLNAYQESEQNRKWIDTARGVEGLVRNAGIHAAGVIICADPIWEHAPVQTMDGSTGQVCQYSMNDASKVGLVKMDFLGLRTLRYIRDCCDMVKENHGVEINLLEIPLDDKKTFDMLAEGDVLGVFQMEGGGMRDLLMSIAPDQLEDLIATIALFRPGPMENDLHHKYARRKNGKEEITYRHELLKPILEPTYGILTYQEQISLILQALGNLDLGIATVIMKMISKKVDRTKIARHKQDFMKGAAEKGVSREVGRQLWTEMEAFAGYGFNKAHSASYGLVAYQTAYLKANYPQEFYASYMSSEMANTDKLAWIVDEMKKKDCEVLPPDVNKSQPNFTVENGRVRYGLAAIKGVGSLAVESIASAREEHGEFENIYQLGTRVDVRLVNKGVLEGLVKAGACDNLEGNRRSMLEAVGDALEHGKKKQEDLARGQVGLFGAPGTGPSPSLPNCEDFEMGERLRMEKSSLGFFLSHHPLEDVWEDIKKYTYQTITDLAEHRDGRVVRIGGMFANVQKKTSRRGSNYATFTLEDMTEKVNGVIFSGAYDEYVHLLEEDTFVVMKGRLDIEELEARDDGEQPRKQIKIIAEQLWGYTPGEEDNWVQSKAPDLATTSTQLGEDIVLDDEIAGIKFYGSSEADCAVNIFLNVDKVDDSSMNVIGAHLASRGGNTPVKFRFRINGKDIVVDTGAKHSVIYSPDLREALIKVNGVDEVKLVLDQGS